MLNWKSVNKETIKVPFIPSRCLLQDFSGIPAVLNFTSIRETCELIDETKTQFVNPLCPTDLILDHAIADVAKK